MSLEWGTIVKSINWTLVFNLVNFAFLLWILQKLLFKPALEYLDRRREQTAGHIAAAQRSEAQANELVEQRQTELQQARDRSDSLLDDARRESERLIEEAKSTAKAEAARILEDGKSRLEQERDRMIHELREAYADVAILGAERVLDREIRTEDHRRLLDQLLDAIDEETLRTAP